MQNVLIAKTHTLAVETEKFSDEVRAFVFAYGVRQILADAGSAFKTADEKLGAAKKKLDGLLAGNIGRSPSERASADPVVAEAIKIAKAKVAAQIKIKGWKLDKDFDKDTWDRWVDETAVRPDVMAAAQIAHDAKAGLAGLNLDLGA